VFFDPNNFNPSGYGINLHNMGVIFHDGLHGFTRLSDPDLQRALGCATVTPPPDSDSSNITDYVQQFLSVPETEPENIRSCQ